MRISVEMALESKNMPMTKPIKPSERSLERTPSSPLRMATSEHVGTSHPG